MSKIISAGILLQYEDKFLLGHPTELTGTTHGWGILKGKVDEGESTYKAALREFAEESGVNIEQRINGGSVQDFPYPFFSYAASKKKTVYVFWMIDHTGSIFREKLTCPSLVPGTDKPEIDNYKWVTVDKALEIVTESQKALFKQVRKLL